MSFSIVKNVLAVSAVGLLSLSATVHAADEDFLGACTNAWMQKINDSAEKVDYKNFGEKYCTCASNQLRDKKDLTQDMLQKAMQLCMSRTLLHDAMDSVEEEVGLSEAKDTDVMEYCEDRWKLIYPKQTDDDKKITTAYCECAKPKLMDLIKQADNMTDKQYDDAIDSVAAACSGNVKQETPPTASGTTNSSTPATPTNSTAPTTPADTH
ncbi:hypothetical protein [Legionella fallonii]|uniref:Uncharacterized protein n=1 Tax=Legionella fallonii LLAP-10 TaxID=1212491 RepID=A0A098G600_9GAMM|nr:hypothetical protein [Legionella fallonii]CEG56930.1 conserved exported protein of unknown function [Legionella fallonii LLAP-10]